MILTSLAVDTDELRRRTGWEIKPQGACRDDACVPLPDSWDATDLAERIGMPLLRDEEHGVWALGPSAGPTGRVLSSARLPDIVLPDVRTGEPFALSSLRGQKVLLVAWASW